MKQETRKLTNVHNVEIKRQDGKFIISFQGTNTNQKIVHFVIICEWWLWIHIAKEALKAWTEERSERLTEIHRVNAAFKEQ